MDKKYIKYGDYYYLKDNKGLIDASKAYVRNSNGSYSLYNSKSKPYRLEDVVITPKKEYGVKDALKDLALIKVNEALEHPVSKAAGYALDPSRHIGAGMQALYNYLYPDNNSGISFKDYYKDPYSHPGVVPGSGANEGLTAIASFAPVTLGISNIGKVGDVANKTLGSLDNLDNKLKSRIFKYLSKKYGLHNTENLYRDFDVLQNNNDMITGNLGFRDPKLLNQHEYPALLNQHKYPVLLDQHEYPKLLEQPESIKLLNAGEKSKLQEINDSPKLLGWATQEVMDKYKDPKMRKALLRRLKAFSESRAFYEMPTEDMSAMELADLSRRLIGRDNRVVRGVQIGPEELEIAIKKAKNKTDKETFQRILDRFDERVRENNNPEYNFAIFSKDGITDDEKRILADYFLTRIPDGGYGYRSGQPRNIRLNRDLFDTLYSSNKIGDSYGYLPFSEASGKMPLIGSIDLRAKELRDISDPMELLERGNLRTKIAKDEYRIKKLKEKGILDPFVSTVKDRKEFDNNYLGIRLKEGKPDIYDRTAYLSIKKYLDEGISSRGKDIYYVDKSGEMRKKRFYEKQRQIYESIDGKNIVTQNSLELKSLINKYLNTKNNSKKEEFIRRIYYLLRKHSFITKVPGDPNRFFDLNKRFFQEKTLELKRSGVRRHYLTSGRKGQKVGDVHEIYDVDELDKKYKSSPFSRKISNNDGLTTAGFSGIGMTGLLNILNNNDSKKNKK